MNVSTFERAQVARFAYEEARSTGSLDCMRAICYVLRNRLKNGWGDGTWLWLMENHVKVQGNERCTFGAISDGSPAVPAGITASLDPQDRLLQLIIRDIDDIYMGQSEDDTKTVVQDALYWQFIDRPAHPWFVEHIVRDPANHPRVAQVGPIAFFE